MRRFVFAGIIVSTLACNAILGITDLTDPGPLPGADSGADGNASPPGAADASNTGDAAPDAKDAGIPACVGDPLPDPCLYTVEQNAGSIFPTWPVTQDLQLNGPNQLSTQPLHPQYTDTGAGVAEASTKMKWHLVDVASDYNAGVEACTAVGAGWRIPTYTELVAIQFRNAVLTSGTYAKCWPDILGEAPTKQTWSSTPVPSTGASAGNYVAFETGCGTLGGYDPATSSFGVRCVNYASQPAHFVISQKDDTVYAMETHIEWERTGALVRGFDSARAHCDTRGARVPSAPELAGIIDRRTTALFDAKMFPALPTNEKTDAGAPYLPRAIVSQTIFNGSQPGYESVALVNGPWGAVDTTPQTEDGQPDILVRCVRER